MENLALVLVIVVALGFDFVNGFHDAANSIATVVSTRVLSPRQAVVWAAVFNFVAAFGFGVSVARTVGKGVVDAAVVDQWVILGGLVGAIAERSPNAHIVVTDYPVPFVPGYSQATDAVNAATIGLNDQIDGAVQAAAFGGVSVELASVEWAFFGHQVGDLDPFFLRHEPRARPERSRTARANLPARTCPRPLRVARRCGNPTMFPDDRRRRGSPAPASAAVDPPSPGACAPQGRRSRRRHGGRRGRALRWWSWSR